MASIQMGSLAIVLAMGTWAHGQNWTSVEHLKPGSELIVETTLTQSGVSLEHACRLVTSDSNNLTCMAFHRSGPTQTLPAHDITAVYKVEKRRLSASLLAETGFAVGAGSAFVGLPLTVVSVALIVAAIAVAIVHRVQDVSGRVHGTTGNPGERLRLVYFHDFKP